MTLDLAVTPVEVYGSAAGGTSSASVTQNIWLPNAPSGTVKLHMQVHNIRWDGMASVKVNNSSTTIIDNTNCPPDTSVSVMATFSPFGGITGGFDTITCNMTFSSGIVTQGANTITFYFNGTTGTNCTNYTNYPNNFCNESAGYRVVSFQLVDSGSNNLIPAAEIYYVDPSTFTASTTQSDITAGYQLFTNTGAAGTPIKGYVNGSYVTLNANCSTCHVADLKNRSGSGHQDGYDLTYFNYSPSVIQARSMFHNLSSTQGAQIAAYILSLRSSVPQPGLPWNPPYQPGSVLDSNPIIDWSAGAGVSAVQVDDAHFASNCVSGMSSWTYSTYVNSRTTCLDLELPTWNSWLPSVAPQDAYAANSTDTCGAFPSPDSRHCEAFTQDVTPGQTFGAYSAYTKIALEEDGTPTTYGTSIGDGSGGDFSNWSFATYDQFMQQGISGYLVNTYGPDSWPVNEEDNLYSVGQWAMVKAWEIMHLYGLEGFTNKAFPTPSSPEHAAWPYGAGYPFQTSPNLDALPQNSRNHFYLSLAWYQLQMILNDGNGTLVVNVPIDYPYLEPFLISYDYTTSRINEWGYWAWKAVQGEAQRYANVGHGPEYTYLDGPSPQYFNPFTFLSDIRTYLGNADGQHTPVLTNAQIKAVVQPYVVAWYNFFSQFTAGQYCTGNWLVGTCSSSGSTTDPSTLSQSDFLGGALWWLIPNMDAISADSTVMTNLRNFGAVLYPTPAGSWTNHY